MLRVYPKELKVIKKFIKKGGVVFDVGACEGEWTKEVKDHVANVVAHCFEPIPKSFYKLQDCLGGKYHTFLNNFGISNTIGRKDFYWYEQSPGGSGYFRRAEAIEKRFEMLPPTVLKDILITTLDAYCTKHRIERINFLKIDTEGADFDVMLGAENLFRNKQIDFVEFEYGDCWQENGKTLRDVFDFAEKYDYQLYKITDDRLMPIDHANEIKEDYVFELFLLINRDWIENLEVD